MNSAKVIVFVIAFAACSGDRYSVMPSLSMGKNKKETSDPDVIVVNPKESIDGVKRPSTNLPPPADAGGETHSPSSGSSDSDSASGSSTPSSPPPQSGPHISACLQLPDDAVSCKEYCEARGQDCVSIGYDSNASNGYGSYQSNCSPNSGNRNYITFCTGKALPTQPIHFRCKCI